MNPLTPNHEYPVIEDKQEFAKYLKMLPEDQQELAWAIANITWNFASHVVVTGEVETLNTLRVPQSNLLENDNVY